MRTRRELIEEIVENGYAVRRALAVKSGARGNHAEITASQWAVLAVVLKRNRVSATELAKALGITASAATQLVDELAGKGFLLRKGDPRDRRACSLALPRAFKKKIGEMKARRLARLTRIFGALTDRELAEYAALNKKIADAVLRET